MIVEEFTRRLSLKPTQKNRIFYIFIAGKVEWNLKDKIVFNPYTPVLK